MARIAPKGLTTVTKRLLVNTGNGMFGRALIEQLLDRDDIEIRAMVRDASKFPLTGSNLEVVEADMDDPATLEPVTRDITHAFITSPMDEHITEREVAMIDACKANGNPLVINIAGAVNHEGDQLDSMHKAARQHLMDSGLPWTIVSPNSVMETSLMSFKEQIAMGQMFGVSGDGRIGLVALDDVARVMAEVVTGEGHEGQNYYCTGPAAVTLGEVAEAFTKVLPHPVEYVNMSDEDFTQMMIEYAGFKTKEQVEIGVMCHLRAWREGRASMVTDTVKEVTGQDPMSVEEWIRANKDAFVS